MLIFVSSAFFEPCLCGVGVERDGGGGAGTAKRFDDNAMGGRGGQAY